MPILILSALLALIIGLAAGWALASSRSRNEIREAKEQTLADADRLHSAAIQAEKERYAQALAAMKSQFESSTETMRAQLANATSEMLKERQREFRSQSQESIEQIVRPLKDDIARMQQTVRENTEKTIDFNGQLRTGIENVLRQSQAAKASADRLANALTVGSKTQGIFGERILTELLQAAGLVEGRHFDTQSFITDSEGQRVKADDGSALQPDVTLHVENGHDVIIDAKTSMAHYIAYQEATTKDERDRCLAEHVRSIKAHVKSLATKDYSAHLQGALDYVIMFVPVSQALYLATQADPNLWRDAMAQKVYIADEQTLFAALKIIDLNWRQQAQAANQQEVFRLANTMLDRVGQFLDHYSKVGESLEAARKSFDAGRAKLADSGQSIPVTARQLIALGAKFEKKRTTAPSTAALLTDD